MKHQRTLVSLLSAFLLLAAPALADSSRVERYEGVARSPSGELLYRERHEVVGDGKRPVKATTVYYDGSGKEIGRLESDFSRSPYAPSYRFSDRRSGKSEAAEVNGKSVKLRYQGEQKELRAQGDLPLVVGQGLHHFARLNLERLARESATVEFAIPSRLDSYRFRVRPLASPGPGVVRLRIEPDSIILRTLAPNLEVDYELSTRRLLRYRGVSNLEGQDGSTQQVVIRYAYGGSK